MAATKWFNGLTGARDSLQRQPACCPVIPGVSQSGSEVRQLFYGRRRHRYRILFTIGDDTVLVLRVLHGARAAEDAEA